MASVTNEDANLTVAVQPITHTDYELVIHVQVKFIAACYHGNQVRSLQADSDR